MDSRGLQIKVGLFVMIGLVLLCVLLINFSKGTSVFHGTYTLKLHATNVGGLKLRAGVLLAGVNVGDVSDIQLAPDGKSVTIILKIYKTTKIYSDARFVIETAGFLGDNFVAVIPTNNKGPVWTDGQDVECEAPFDLQEVARSATGFITRVDQTVQKIEDSVTKLQKTVLNEETMTNLSVTVANLRSASDEAAGAVGNIQGIVATNSEQINAAVSNLVVFSQRLSQVADNANNIIATNGVGIAGAVSNLQDATESLKQIADDVHSGKGPAGELLEDPQLAANLQTTVNNLTVASSNLNQLGLWHFLWHHESVPPYTNATAQAVTVDQNK
jgi:phospholipid/cholesterol/gamma-HCH transport system substrate-binding protein